MVTKRKAFQLKETAGGPSWFLWLGSEQTSFCKCYWPCGLQPRDRERMHAMQRHLIFHKGLATGTKLPPSAVLSTTCSSGLGF